DVPLAVAQPDGGSRPGVILRPFPAIWTEGTGCPVAAMSPALNRASRSSVTATRSERRLLGRDCHADNIAGLEFPDQALQLFLTYIGTRDAHPVHAARAARARTVDDHGVPRIKETGDVRNVCLRREPHQRKGADLDPARRARRSRRRLKRRA